MTRRLRTPLVAVVAMMLLGALSPLRASGSTIDDKKQQAAQLEQQIQNNGDRIAALGEQYNGAVLEYQNAQAGVADAKRHLASAAAQHEKLSSLVAARGAELYQGAQDPTSLLPNTDIQSVNELGVRTQYGAVATGNDEQLISNLVRAKQDLKIERTRLDHQVSAAKQKRDLIAQAQQKVQEANSQETELLSQVKGQIATLIAQEKARQAAAVKAALEQLSHQGNGASRVPSSDVGAGAIPNLPAPSPRAAAAISFAEAQLGKPYEYAATGPNTYDCSGLTMMAWASAGVSMPHYSGAQYQMFPHVPLDQLEPGDLLFWGGGGSEHVAMYIGGGLQIAATHTGDYVRIQPIGSNPVGAARP
jgi:cell wall-associated NlpC family hydrolase